MHASKDENPKRAAFRLNAKEWTALGLISVLALGYRVWGLDFGLPHDSRPDEIPNIQIALRLLGDIVGGADPNPKGFLNPGTFNYGSLYYYLLTLCYWLHFSAGQILGGESGGFWVDYSQYLFAYQKDPTPFHLIIRSLSALSATLSVPALFFAARLWQPNVRSLPWLAAILLTPAYLMVRNAHFGTPDSLLCLILIITLGSLLYLQRTLENSEFSPSKALTITGVLIGLGVSVKAPAVLMFAPFAWVCLQARSLDLKNRMTLLAKGSGWALLALALSSPWLFLDMARAANSLMYEQGAYFTYGLNGIPVGWQFYPTFALPIGLGFLLYACALVGIIRHWPRKENPQKSFDLTLLLTLLAFFLSLGPNMRVMTRYAMPLVPLLMLLGASTLYALHTKILAVYDQAKAQHLTAQSRAVVSALLYTILAGLVLIEPLRSSSLWNRLLNSGDTRDVARDWIVANVAGNTPVASGPRLGHITLPLNYGQLWLETGPNNLTPPMQTGFEAIDPRTRLTNRYDVEGLKQLGVRYVVLYGGDLLFSTPPWEMARFLKNGEPVFHISPLKEKVENMLSRPIATLYDPMDALFIPYAGLQDVAWSGPEIFIFDLQQF